MGNSDTIPFSKKKLFSALEYLGNGKRFSFFPLRRICLTTDGGGFLSQREGRRNPDLSSSFSRKGIGGSIISQTFGPEAAFSFLLDKFVLMPGWKAVLFPSPPLQFWNQGNEAGGGGRGEERREEAKKPLAAAEENLAVGGGRGGRGGNGMIYFLSFSSSPPPPPSSNGFSPPPPPAHARMLHRSLGRRKPMRQHLVN